MRVWWQDESRLGLHLPLPRRLTAEGVKPIQPHQPLYQYYWLYAAVEPATGQACWWEMPALDSSCFEAFLQQFSAVVSQDILDFGVRVLDTPLFLCRSRITIHHRPDR